MHKVIGIPMPMKYYSIQMEKLVRFVYILITLTFLGAPVILLELVEEEKSIGIFNTGDFEFFYPAYYGTALTIVFFYTCVFWLMPRLLDRYGIGAASIGAFAAYVLHTIVESVIDYMVAEAHGLLSSPDLLFFGIIGNFIMNLIVLLFALGFFFFENLIVSERRQLKIREEKLQLEIDFLRSQLNPHFIFNVLNNIYGTAMKNGNEESAKQIAQLSGLMRYMLQECHRNLVRLDNEVEYLNNYIKLQEKRFSSEDDIKVSFEVKGCTSDRWIAPMIFITFLENAFMHGINLKNSSFIEVMLQIEDHGILYCVKNSVHPSNSGSIKSHGIGLKNTKKRLDLIYKDKHKLDIVKEPDCYSINLLINDKT